MKPPPYCSSLQDGGGFLCLRFFGWRGSARGSAFDADVLVGFGVRSHGLGGGRGFTGQRGRGSAPSAALGRLEDGAPAPRARYAPLCMPQMCVCLHRYERNIAKMDK